MFADPSLFLHESLPFILGFLYLLLAPLIDYVTWRWCYVKFYDESEMYPVTADDLAQGASWAVDMAGVVPGVLLTAAGVLLAFDHVNGAVAAIAIACAVVPFCLLGIMQRRGNLHDRDADPHIGPYSAPQVAVAALDLVAIAILAF